MNSITYTATGGEGGGNGAVDRLSGEQAGHDANIDDGYYKDFGSSGGFVTSNNSSASAGTGYVAGGSGGTRDAAGTYDRSGLAGEGGNAGEQISGTAYVAIGQSITYRLGSGMQVRRQGIHTVQMVAAVQLLLLRMELKSSTRASGSHTA